jgi:hypothetical protein
MKLQLAGIGVLVLLSSASTAAEDISEQKTWQQSYPVSSSSPRLFVRNIWGNVTVRAGAAGEIAVTVDERRWAPTQELIEKTKTLIRLDVETSGDSVSMVVGNPDRTERRNEMCRGCRIEYQFEIAVPAGTHIDVGTVTDGRVEVAGVHGPVNASNVNGPVRVRDLNDCASIESVNGALDVVFARAPSENCNLKTINGRITVGLPANAGLDALLSMGHGEVESDFDVEPMTLPAKVERQQHDDRIGYRLEQPAGIRLGAGGPTFTFASLNGDVRIVKNK